MKKIILNLLLFTCLCGWNIEGKSANPKRIAILVHATTAEGGVIQDYGAESHERFMEAFEGHDVEIITPGTSELSKEALLDQYDPYDLIVIHPTISGADVYLRGMAKLVGEKPVLSLKSFAYQSGRWAWTSTNAQNCVGTNITHINVATNLHNHPIFKNLQFDGEAEDELRLYTGSALPAVNSISKVEPLPFRGGSWNRDWDQFNHLLASHHDTRTETTQMHEIIVDNNPVNKYIMIAISTEGNAFAALNDNAIQLLKNAVDYLTDPTWCYDYENDAPTGGNGGNENVICDIHFNNDLKWENSVYTESDDMPVVKTYGNMGFEPDRKPFENCSSEHTTGGIRFNGSDAAAEIEFDVTVKKLNIYARTTSGSTPAIMAVQCLRASDRTVLWGAEQVQLGLNDEAICGEFVKEDIAEESCILRITRSGSGTFAVLRILAEGEAVMSDDASLRRLTVSAGALTPAFHPNIDKYAVTMESSVKSIIFTATPNHRSATVEGAGEQQLVIGENIFPIAVTAEDGKTQKIYTITVMLVEPTPISKIDITGYDEVSVSSSILLTPVITPEFVTDRTVKWTTSNPAIASLVTDANDRAVVTGISEGAVVIKVVSVANPEIFTEKTITVIRSALPQRQMERIDRGLVAVRNGNNVFFSWRLYGTDPIGVKFNLYRNDETTPVNSQPLDAAHTNFTLVNGTPSANYSVATLVGEIEIERSAPVSVWVNQYLSIPVEKPTGRVWNGTTFVPYTNYDIGDVSVADLDGDGQYDIVFKWTPQNAQDNANEGYTANYFLDAYKLDGTKLWGKGNFIDLGNNIRAGAHYAPFLVYDFDGDGKAEIIIKTADGTKDAQGTVIGNANANYIQNSGSRYGRILSGNEFLSVFEGVTGKLLDTKPYVVARGNVGDWGDTYGNRVDRFLATVAYLDGVRPSAVMCRGYYVRTTLSAWDWDGKELKTCWIFDTRPGGILNNALRNYEGQGNHNLAVADVDGDGKDEIIYGAMAVNNDGTPLYSTGFNHGDAMHAGKLDPTRPGLQVVSCRETPNPWGLEMHDARTGELIWGVRATTDIGRGLCADIDPEYPGEESWSAGGLGTYATDGTRLANSISPINMAIWWDGDTGRELFDGTTDPTIRKVTPSAGPGGDNPRRYTVNNIFTFSGTSTNGGTKQNPCLQVDLLGDWREEVLVRASDNSELRIYTTVTPTVHTGAGAVPELGIPTLMHDNTYRMAITWQNSAYNQPPHTGFFLGYNMENVPRMEGAVHTVTFDPNGGMFEDNVTNAKQIKAISGTYFALPKVTKTGNMFVGWYINGTEIFDPTVVYKEDIIIQAQWTHNTYILCFDANATDVTSPQSRQVTYDETIGELPVINRNGYTFKEWNTEANGSGQTYTASMVYCVADNLTLYAIWTTVLSVESNLWTDLKVYPNPVKDVVIISGLDGGEIIIFTDVAGRKWMNVTASGVKEDIPIRHLPKGAYLLTIIKDKAEKTIKLVVE